MLLLTKLQRLLRRLLCHHKEMGSSSRRKTLLLTLVIFLSSDYTRPEREYNDTLTQQFPE